MVANRRRGHWAEAERFADLLLVTGEKRSNRELQMRAINALGAVKLARGDLAGARKVYFRTVALIADPVFPRTRTEIEAYLTLGDIAGRERR